MRQKGYYISEETSLNTIHTGLIHQWTQEYKIVEDTYVHSPILSVTMWIPNHLPTYLKTLYKILNINIPFSKDPFPIPNI